MSKKNNDRKLNAKFRRRLDKIEAENKRKFDLMMKRHKVRYY